MVMYHHLMGASLNGWSPSAAWSWPVSASAAVLVFFALSGYVIGVTNDAAVSGRAVRAYVWRRLVRLVPINTLAVLTGCAAATAWGVDTVITHLLFLESYVDYGAISIPVVDGNGNLWSLNHEAVCYALFIGVWWWRPRLRHVGAASLLLVTLGWYTPIVPLFVGCYAAGFLFWLAGLALAWRTSPGGPELSNWPSGLLIALVTWKLETLRQLAGAWPLPYFSGPTVKLYHLDFLPVTIWLLAAVARRRFPLLAWIRMAAMAIPVIGLLARATQWPAQTLPASASSTSQLGALCTLYLVAVVAWKWRPDLKVFRTCAPLGAISFALYALSRPIEHAVFRAGRGLPGTALAFLACAAVVIALSLVVAWYVERRIQPAIHARLLPAKRQPGPAVVAAKPARAGP